jgi:hypothetical protein
VCGTQGRRGEKSLGDPRRSTLTGSIAIGSRASSVERHFPIFFFPSGENGEKEGKDPDRTTCVASVLLVYAPSRPVRPARWIEGELELCLGEWNGFQMRRRLLKSFGWCHVLLRTGVSIVRARSVHELT